MAYLGNTLINGSLRCLNKAYFNDLSVSDTMTVASLSTTGNATIGGTLGVTGATTIAGTLTLTKTTDVSGTANNSPALIIGGTATGKHIEIDLDEIQAKTNGTSVGDLWINNDGGTVYIKNLNSTTSTITTGNITTLKASTATADNVTVNNVLKSSKWDISNVANLANDFMVAPTIKISSSGTVTIASLNTTAKTCRLTFSDSSQINSDEFAGCKWYAGSKVRITFTVNGTLNSNIEGTIVNNMNTTAGTLVVDVTLDNTTNLANGTYEADDSTIMLYEISNSGTLSPVGIRMTAYGTNNSSYIDMYGGTTASSYTQPVFRIGNLNGITYNAETLSAQWGVYTYNGYFEGAIVANEGKIANFTIASDKLYTGTHSAYNTNADGIFISDTYISFGKQALTYFKNDGTGKIGNWKIDSISLYNGTFGTENSAMVCTGSSTAKAIGGSDSISGWTFTSGANFGVTKTGTLYANDVNISGAVNATALHVGSSTSANHLIYENSTIDLQTDWLKFDDGVVTIGQDNNSQIFLDGQSIDLKDENSLTYFYVGDKRINGVYTFTMEHPYIVTNNYDSNSIGVNYVINSNYPVTVFDEENNEIPIDRIYSLQIVSDSYEFLAGKVYKILFTTSDPVYNFSYVQKPNFIGSNAVVFAKRGKSYGANSFTEGIDTTASGMASHAEGENTTASGSRSHVEGQNTTASGNYGSHAEGNSTIASGDWGSHAEGNDTTASSLSSHAEGDGTTASGWYSHAEGDDTTASGNYGSHAEGNGTVASSDSSHAEGYHTTASGGHSHAEGMYTTASGNYGSHAEGCNTVASGYISHAEGDDTTASGRGSHSSGRYSVASGEYSHTQGISTEASGRASYAEGNSSMASGNWSHAEGYFTSSQGSASHAEGGYSVAVGVYSHAQGRYSKALEECSCAIGRSTTASGKGSFASGDSTYATVDYQTVIGKYNATTKVYSSVVCSDTLFCDDDLIVDGTTYTHDAGNYAFIIGNGTDDDNRSNALTVDWNGYIKIYNPYITVETAPSSNNTNMAVQVCDKNGSRIGHFGYSYSTDGKIGISLQGYRNVNGTNHYNTLNLLHDTNGNAVVSLSNPNAWKDALNLRLNYRHIDMGTNKHLQLASTDSYPTFFIYGTGSGLSPFMASIILNTTGGSITVADNKVSITGSGKNSGYTLTFPGNYFQLNIISFNPFTATVSA